MNTNQKNWKAKLLTKKGVALMVAGAFAVTGLGLASLPHSVAEAAYRQHAGWNQREITPDEIAQQIADTFGTAKQDILDYNAKGWQLWDLERAAHIAYVANKPLADVLNAKTASNHWREVGESFGLTPDSYRLADQKLMSQELASQFGIEQSKVDQLIKDGYHPRDISIAASLAKKADKSIDKVIQMKKLNNRWADVAVSLGISESDFRQCLYDSDNGRGFGRHGGMHNGNGYHQRGGNWHDGSWGNHHEGWKNDGPTA